MLLYFEGSTSFSNLFHTNRASKKGSHSSGAIDTDMNKGSTWDMSSPDSVAKVILEKIEKEELDIIPENIGIGMFNTWKENPEKLAEIFHNIYYEENFTSDHFPDI